MWKWKTATWKINSPLLHGKSNILSSTRSSLEVKQLKNCPALTKKNNQMYIPPPGWHIFRREPNLLTVILHKAQHKHSNREVAHFWQQNTDTIRSADCWEGLKMASFTILNFGFLVRILSKLNKSVYITIKHEIWDLKINDIKSKPNQIPDVNLSITQCQQVIWIPKNFIWT